jgi:hypothetical protein
MNGHVNVRHAFPAAFPTVDDDDGDVGDAVDDVSDDGPKVPCLPDEPPALLPHDDDDNAHDNDVDET